MKSDELYIAEIYEKAERLKAEEAKNAQASQDVKAVQGKKNAQSTQGSCGGRKLRNLHVWQGLAAAACLCLIVFGVVRTGQTKAPADGNNTENIIKTRQSPADMQRTDVQINSTVMPFSEDEVSAQEASVNDHSADMQRTVEGTVCEFIPAADTPAQTSNHTASDSCAQLTLQLKEDYIDEAAGLTAQLQIFVTDGEVFVPGAQVTLTIARNEIQWELVSADEINDEKEKED